MSDTAPVGSWIDVQRLDTVRLALITAIVVVIPFNQLFHVYAGEPGRNMRILLVTGPWLGPIDALLVVLVFVSIPFAWESRRRKPLGLGLAGIVAFTAVVAVHVVVSPTLLAATMLLRLAGAAAVVLTIQSIAPRDLASSVIWPLSVVASIQSVLAVSQTFIFGSGKIYSNIGPDSNWTGGWGTMEGPFDLAALLVFSIAAILSMGRFRRLHPFWWISIVASSAAVATALGRSGVLGIMLISGTFVGYGIWTRNRRLWMTGMVTVLPMLATTVALRSAWVHRVQQTAQLDTGGRIQPLNRALEIIASHPLRGVGPLQYGPHLLSLSPPVSDNFMVHNVALMIAAEFGVLVGAAIAVWALLLTIRSFRTSVYAVAALVSITPFLLFDNLHYLRSSGFLTVGLWIAILEFHWRQRPIAAEASSEVVG